MRAKGVCGMCVFFTCGIVKMIVDQHSRDKALKAKQESDARLEARVDAAVKAHGLDDDDLTELRASGCFPRFGACLPFGLRRPRAQRIYGEESGVQLQRGQSSMDARIFGQRGKQATAADKLQHAAQSVQAHVESLSEKASLARAKAAEFMSQNNKAQALMQLKKAKAAEKQLETATATHAALESQVDVLEQSALQREVASALSASVATSKKRHKGLLSKAENAVDGAEEIKDMSEDVATALGGLQVEQWDEDELLAELEEMGAPEPTPAAEPKKVVKFAEVSTIAEAKNVVFGVNAEQWPEAPTASLLQSQDDEAHAVAQ